MRAKQKINPEFHIKKENRNVKEHELMEMMGIKGKKINEIV
jgi:hypothetical protein